MSATHSFVVEIAQKVGVNAAILLNGINFWCEKNKANRHNYHDGLYWTYNSVKAWNELYPYMGKSAINAALKKLEDMGYIKSGNYNASPYDRTKWYAITDSGLALYGSTVDDGEIDLPKSGNGNPRIGEPIPVSNQLFTIDPIKKESAQRESYDTIIAEYTASDELADAIREFIKMRKLNRSPMTNRALRQMLKRLDGLADDDSAKIELLDTAIMNSWKTVYKPRDSKDGRGCNDSNARGTGRSDQAEFDALGYVGRTDLDL